MMELSIIKGGKKIENVKLKIEKVFR